MKTIFHFRFVIREFKLEVQQNRGAQSWNFFSFPLPFGKGIKGKGLVHVRPSPQPSPKGRGR